MFVSVSTECLPDLSLEKAMERLAELEFVAVELDVHEQGGHLKPGLVAADPEAAIEHCSDLQRLRPIAISFSSPDAPDFFDRWLSRHPNLERLSMEKLNVSNGWCLFLLDSALL